VIDMLNKLSLDNKLINQI